MVQLFQVSEAASFNIWLSFDGCPSINKVGIKHIDCEVDKAKQEAKRINKHLAYFEIDCQQGKHLQP